MSTPLKNTPARRTTYTFMETRGDRHPTDLAGLRGSCFVGATETE